ncbi:phosphomannomutase/phosphoglucomutase [Marinimicrobium alkaliphilum]|uniref:phosphomannomutase/phosphoglucomutase n=1 Tax=Marinimicrobium alkaliphilum TaxID=2202654 RepID=UPI000DBA9CAA|nr:phosphomannomutase/phosphoglucomutase [Marinimicrobium alkaliphilum]
MNKKILPLLIALVVVANALLAWHLRSSLVDDVTEERLAQQQALELRARVNALRHYLDETEGQMTAALALADPSGLETPDAREVLARSIAEQFPNPLAVRLIPLGSAVQERDHAVPIRFAELDLIRRAERSEPTPPEMVRVGDQWFLHWARPLPSNDDAEPWGTLLVTLDRGELQQHVSRFDSRRGQTRLIQRFPGTHPLLLLQDGNAADEAGTSEAALADSYWVVTFTPSPLFLQEVREPPQILLIIVGSSTLLSLLLVWVGYRLAGRRYAVPKAGAKSPAGKRQGPAKADTQATESRKPEASDRASPERLTSTMYQDQDILDIAMADEDQDLLGMDEPMRRPKPPVADEGASVRVPGHIFRSYDIRGIVGTDLTLGLAHQVGQALGSAALDLGESAMLVARDARIHSPDLCRELMEGIVSTGCNVIDIGVVPTPVLYFATYHESDTSSGVMVTASHNPADYNGFKMVIGGNTLSDEEVQGVRERIEHQRFRQGKGTVRERNMVSAYIDRIVSDIAPADELTLVVDAGNAVTGTVAPKLFEALGCRVVPLFCELDGNFPNHEPDPTRDENLTALKAKVAETGADLGVAFDGDGDRLVVVTGRGEVIWPDQLLMLFARDVLTRHPGADVLYDVKCSRQLAEVVTSYGGRPIMWKTGHSPMKAKMIETGALIGGEYSGHIFIKDRWYGFDDGLYAMARLLDILVLRDQTADEVFESFPRLPSTPEIKIAVADERKFDLVHALAAQGQFPGGEVTRIDGVRVDFSVGWGLVRASNTSPALTLRFEATSEAALEKIKQLFKRELLKVAPELSIDL